MTELHWTSGHTHLLEHLALSTLGQVAPGQSRLVTGPLTGFHAMGTPEEVAGFLEGVCRSTEFSGAGVARRTWYQEGRAFEAQVDPRPQLKKSPDARACVLRWPPAVSRWTGSSPMLTSP